MALALTAIAAVVCGIGWFFLSWRVEQTPAGDAAGEALGVALGVLIVVSIVGAVRNFSRRTDPPAPQGPAGDSGGDSEIRS
jgi:hypothetical protein